MSNYPDDFSWKQFERYYGEDKREFTRADVKWDSRAIDRDALEQEREGK